MPSSSFFQRSSTTLIYLIFCASTSLGAPRQNLASRQSNNIQYSLAKTYTPSNFFDEFTFINTADPEHGYVTYLDRTSAANDGIIGSDANSAYLGVDSVTYLTDYNKNDYYNTNGVGRKSVRLEDYSFQFTHGLVLADIPHMPGAGSACGVWPTFFTLGSGMQPANGEIDILQGINTQQGNQMSLHTDHPSSISAGDAMFGMIVNSDCDVGTDPDNPNLTGCRIVDPDSSTYGQYSGGYWAMQWTSDFVRIWYWPYGSEPPTIHTDLPDPEQFGKPRSSFSPPSSLNADQNFNSHHLAIDTTFCGDLGDATWGSTSDPSTCAGMTGYTNCAQYVAQNPSAFSNAYWQINSIKIYTEVAPATSTSPTTNSATSSVVSNSTSLVTTPTTSTSITYSNTTSTIPSPTSYTNTTSTASVTSTTSENATITSGPITTSTASNITISIVTSTNSSSPSYSNTTFLVSANVVSSPDTTTTSISIPANITVTFGGSSTAIAILPTITGDPRITSTSRMISYDQTTTTYTNTSTSISSGASSVSSIQTADAKSTLTFGTIYGGAWAAWASASSRTLSDTTWNVWLAESTNNPATKTKKQQGTSTWVNGDPSKPTTSASFESWATWKAEQPSATSAVTWIFWNDGKASTKTSSGSLAWSTWDASSGKAPVASSAQGSWKGSVSVPVTSPWSDRVSSISSGKSSVDSGSWSSWNGPVITQTVYPQSAAASTEASQDGSSASASVGRFPDATSSGAWNTWNTGASTPAAATGSVAFYKGAAATLKTQTATVVTLAIFAGIVLL